MFLKTVMMLLCTAGIALYVRFLVALWKDCGPVRAVIGCGCAAALARAR
jgi:hypothetical protein